MNVEQMKTVLKEILTKTDLTPCVVGHRGVGKTAGIIQVCREIGRRYVPVRLGQMEVGDLVGIPFRDGPVMHWSRPCWWPTEEDEATVVHCDELNRAQQEDTLQAIFQFVEPPAEGQSRALHTHTLSQRHKVVGTINPPDGTYQVATLDRALIDRMVLLYVETDYHCWARYARERRLDENVRQFLAGNPQLLAKQGAAMEMEAEPTERGWEMVSVLRQSCRFPQELEMEVYAGIVGREAAVTFLRWQGDRRGRPVTAPEVLDSWPAVAERAAAQRDDLQAATMNDLITLLQGVNGIAAQQEDNLVGYIDCLPRDLRFGLVKALLKIPVVAQALSQDKYDVVVLDAIRAISSEA
jgi:AAA domain (dynein-related subfamily)